MNKPISASAYANDSSTEQRGMSGKNGSFKPSVPVNAVRPRPVPVPAPSVKK